MDEPPLWMPMKKPFVLDAGRVVPWAVPWAASGAAASSAAQAARSVERCMVGSGIEDVAR
jgi:hypothetical protein